MKNINSDEYYEKYYPDIFGTGVISSMSEVLHRMLEKGKKSFHSQILEVGAGNGEHRKFVKHGYDYYVELDLRRPKNQTAINVKRIQGDAQDLAMFDDCTFDRVIATCVLAHLPNPEQAVNEWIRVAKVGSTIDIYVPAEPSILLRMFRSQTTVRKSRKYGINHKSLHYREHRNMWIYMDLILRENSKGHRLKIDKFPPMIPIWNLRLFDVYRITKCQLQ